MTPEQRKHLEEMARRCSPGKDEESLTERVHYMFGAQAAWEMATKDVHDLCAKFYKSGITHERERALAEFKRLGFDVSGEFGQVVNPGPRSTE